MVVVRRTVPQKSTTWLYKLRPGPFMMPGRSPYQGHPHRTGHVEHATDKAENESNEQPEKQRAPQRFEKGNSTVCCWSSKIAVDTHPSTRAYQGWGLWERTDGNMIIHSLDSIPVDSNQIQQPLTVSDQVRDAVASDLVYGTRGSQYLPRGTIYPCSPTHSSLHEKSFTSPRPPPRDILCWGTVTSQ